MRKYLSYLTAETYGFLFVILIYALAIKLFIGDSRGCEGDSEAAEYARSLSQSRLKQLHKDMEKYYKSSVSYADEIRIRGNADVPDEFKDLDVAKVRPRRAHIMVEGCFDHYMYMDFKGIDDSNSKEIILRYGEPYEGVPQKTERLWPI